MTKRFYGLKPDRLDLRDHIFSATKYVSAIPSKIDLRSQMSPVVDQGQLGSCTANSIVSGLREHLEIKNHTPFVYLSRLYLYWHEREMEGTLGQDAGAQNRTGMKVLKNLGVCPEADFPYDISKYNDTPSAKAEADAGAYKISQYSRVSNLTMLKTAVAEGSPVVIGFYVYESFESDEVTRTGIVPLPDVDNEQLLGGHSVLAVGYDDAKSWVICRNSWGTNWGDQGYFYMPYSFWSNDLVMDMWTGK